jgi:hypothetical protein
MTDALRNEDLRAMAVGEAYVGGCIESRLTHELATVLQIAPNGGLLIKWDDTGGTEWTHPSMFNQRADLDTRIVQRRQR